MKKETKTNERIELPCPRIDYEEEEYKNKPPTQETIDIWCVHYLSQEINEGLWGNEICHYECKRPFYRGIAKPSEEEETKEAKRKRKGLRALFSKLFARKESGGLGE